MWGLNWADAPTILLAVGSLVLLEGLLSADNALVLAVMVRHLPKEKQKRALRFGIWGAFIFRAIAVVFASILLHFWQLKVAGGLYLLYLAIKHLVFGEAHDESDPKAAEKAGPGFWGTVVHVEIADVAFSIDSILAAVAMAEGLPARLQQNNSLKLAIIYVGGVLGIIMMRLVAGVFLILLDRFKGLAAGAYYLVGWIGIKLVESGVYAYLHPKEAEKGVSWLPDWAFWAVMGLIVVASLLYRPRRRGPEEPIPALHGDASPNGTAPAPGTASDPAHPA